MHLISICDPRLSQVFSLINDSSQKLAHVITQHFFDLFIWWLLSCSLGSLITIAIHFHAISGEPYYKLMKLIHVVLSVELCIHTGFNHFNVALFALLFNQLLIFPWYYTRSSGSLSNILIKLMFENWLFDLGINVCIYVQHWYFIYLFNRSDEFGLNRVDDMIADAVTVLQLAFIPQFEFDYLLFVQLLFQNLVVSKLIVFLLVDNNVNYFLLLF